MNKVKVTRVFLIICSVLLLGGTLFRDFILLDLSDLSILVYALLGMAFSSFLAICVHELGHLFFGLSQGMKLQRIFMGFIGIDLEGKNIQLDNADVFGYCTMAFRKTNHADRRFAVYILGGLLTSFIYLIFTLACCFKMDGMHFIFGYGAPLSLYLFLFNAIPLEIDHTDTDGKLLLSMIRKDGIASYYVHLLVIQRLMQDKALTELDSALFNDLPTIAEDKREYMLMTYYRYLRALAQNNVSEIMKYDYRLRSLLEYQTDEDLEELYSAILYDCCVFEKNEEGARGLFERQEEYLLQKDDVTAYRILSAYHEKFGNEKNAFDYKQRAIDLLESESIYGMKKLEENILYKRNV